MIVVDTGSTDETAALARECGAAVFPFAWRDDFAAAYNAALDQVTGDWVLCLDADEELLPESRVLVRELIQRPDAMAYYLQRQEAEYEGQTDGFIEMRQLRLCRNYPSLSLRWHRPPPLRGSDRGAAPTARVGRFWTARFAFVTPATCRRRSRRT